MMEFRNMKIGIFTGILLILAAAVSIRVVRAETGATHYVPFNRDQMALILKRTIETKFIPCTLPEKDHVTSTITSLQDFSINWDDGALTIGFTFESDYRLGFLSFHSAGEISVTGQALFNSDEQKLGLKFLELRAFKLYKSNKIVEGIARGVIEYKIEGHEVWPGNPPSTKEVMTRDNFPSLLTVAIAQILPFKSTNKGLTVTLTRLNSLAFTDEAGGAEVNFDFDGVYDQIIKVSFGGGMGVRATITVDPESLTGKVRIENIAALDLKHSMSILDELVRGWVNSKLSGKVIDFCWK